MSAALETIGLVKRFGGLAATRDVSFRLAPGARHALIGPNGAGKTTFVNLLTGVLSPSAGSIRLDGRDVTRLGVDSRVRLGLSRTFQINQLFAELTPLETIGLAVSERLGHGGDFWRVVGTNDEVLREIVDIGVRFGLGDVMESRVGGLPYGKQRQLEIAVAFATRPRVLLLDEPAAGVPEHERRALLASIAELPRETSVLLIEHDMDVVFAFAERISVLVDGALFAEGTPEDIARDSRVRDVYLGGARDG
jgi:branched-chain amino acid transport system ATP-binding protein